MSKKQELSFGSSLKSEPSYAKQNNSEPKKASEAETAFEESGSENEDHDGIDTNFLQELMKDDEKFMDMLVKTNDKAVNDIQAGNLKEALHILERMEKILEYAAINKKILDRNLVIVCLYNISCTYQAMWVLDKCSKYIDAVIYNLDQSLKQDEVCLKEAIGNKSDLTQRTAIRAIKLKKLQFLLKVYLQHCAVLSQLSRHDEALTYAKKSQKSMNLVINECNDCCKDAQKRVEFPQNSNYQDDSHNSSDHVSRTMIDSRRNLDSSSIFRDEVSYLKNILDYAIPFITDLSGTVNGFTGGKTQEILKQTRKSLFNWKNNPENNEKYLRKEFRKTGLPNELKEENRSLLGVQRPVEWLENLNIGTIMHMKPIKYKDYAQKKEFTNEITKDSLQEKVIFQSLIYFTIATEMRFIELSNDSGNKDNEKASQEEIRNREQYRNSEVYHLKSIELVCRYVNKPCPYINHLISSYQKHYNQDLEVIQEESYYSISEPTAQEISQDYDAQNFDLMAQLDDVIQPKKSTPQPQSQQPPKPEPAVALNQKKPELKEVGYEKINRKMLIEQFKEEKNLSSRIRHETQSKDEETPASGRRKEPIQQDEDLNSKSNLSVKLKRKRTEDDETKNVFDANLSIGSVSAKNALSQNISPSSTKQPHYIKESATKHEKPDREKSDSSKYFMKKNYDIPSLNIGAATSRDRVRTTHMTEKNSIDNESGCMSERPINRRKDVLSSSPKNGQVDQNDPAINLFFYKNFNKFIQNLYVQDEKGCQKLIADTHSKLLNGPYSKDASINASMKKASQPQTKKTNASTSKNSANSSKNRSNQTIVTENKKASNSFVKPSTPRERGERLSTKKETEPSPRARMEQNFDLYKRHLEEKEKEAKIQMTNNFVKAINLKDVPKLDFSRMKASDKAKAKHYSARDK